MDAAVGDGENHAGRNGAPQTPNENKPTTPDEVGLRSANVYLLVNFCCHC